MKSHNEGKPFKFKLSTTDTSNISDAETLFRDLKNRDPKIQHLWSHQADILRAYHESIKYKDIALELPTGTGKTLVGLLIAEWRRRAFGQRVVYLCPTRQLAYQVGIRAVEYGIPAQVLVGPQSQYDPSSFADYADARAIAVTTYSGIFNINPRIKDPETVILDDAHAGENYISSMWSLSITREKHSYLYEQIVGLFLEDLPNYLSADLANSDPAIYKKGSIDLLPGPKLISKIEALTDLLDRHADEGNKLIYPWQLIRGQLYACNVFFSWHEILIRPIIPPSLTHRPFSDAKQRIYMSATLGAAGELERITGVPKIHRIPVPTGWDKQSTGRRLFIFPDRSFTPEEYLEWFMEFVAKRDRVLVLAPHRSLLSSFVSNVEQAELAHEILSPEDIETSLDRFTGHAKAILALANRYDGIDLPDDTCRAQIVLGLPTSVNLLERFLWSKLGATLVLRDRIRTRITQAVGRCTRGSTDYAVVLMIGDDLFEFCIKKDNRAQIHPELRAEIEFGLDNSEVEELESLSQLVEVFLSKAADWSIAEQDIAKRRDDSTAPQHPSTKPLKDAAELEVEYQYDLWRGDFGAALEKATRVSDTLPGDELSGYRALWNYLAGYIAYLLSDATGDKSLVQVAADRFYRASQAPTAIQWFAKLSNQLAPRKEVESVESSLITLTSQNVNARVTELGTVGQRFEKLMGQYRSFIQNDDANKFDQGVTELGKLLGFDAEKPDGQGVPDSVWRIGSEIVLLLECKSEENPKSSISISTCRQAQGHQAWQKARPFFDQHAELSTIVISHRSRLDKDAIPHADGLYYISVEEIRKLFAETESCLRSIRSKSVDMDEGRRLEVVVSELSKCHLTPDQVLARLRNVHVVDLEKS